MRRFGLATAAAVGACAAAAPVTEAHGFYSTPDVSIPPWLLAVGAGLVVAISFLAVARLFPTVLLADDRARPIAGGSFLSAVGEMTAAWVGVCLLVIVVVSGLAGVQSYDENFATVFVFITFWVGLAVASAVLGDIYRLFNPWRAVGRAVGALVGSRLGVTDAEVDYPAWLGRLPVVAGLLGFGYLELQGSSTPRVVAIATLIYSAVTWGGMAMYGVERWCARGEAFAVYFNFFSRLAPIAYRGERVLLRRPLAALAGIEPLRGTALVLAVIIGVVSFDGFSSSPLWQDIQKRIVDLFEGPLTQANAARVSTALGILGMTCLIYAAYRLGIRAAAATSDATERARLRRVLAPSLVPIALAYTVAHYMQFLTVRGQAIFAVASDPLGKGWDLFGTAGATPEPIVSATAYWYLEVGAIVLGHVLATFAAHDLALAAFGDPERAVRSQRVMMLIMVTLSVFALWLLSSATEIPFSSR